MPDWRMINDRDGNRYFIDANGRIYVSGEPEFRYKPVSAEGLEYYLRQGEALIKSHHKEEGLSLLKSILALPAASGRITDAQGEASRRINALIKREGERYGALDEKASLLLFRVGGEVTLANERMRYSITVPGGLTVIRRRMRKFPGYSYHGVLAGARFTDNPGAGGASADAYDVLIAVDSERFSQPLRSVTALENNWRRNLGSDTFIRAPLDVDAGRIIYTFSDAREPFYSGVEAFFVDGEYGHCVRVLCTKNVLSGSRDVILKMVRGFKR
jgi:hypothetical protein